jgi:hypothetical protein
MCMSKHDQVGGGETEERGGEKGIGENDEGNVAEKRICFCSILSCLVLSCLVLCYHALSHRTLHLPSYADIIGLDLPLTAFFPPVPFSLSLPPCPFLPVPSSLFHSPCPFLPAPSFLPLPPCSFLSALSSLFLPLCPQGSGSRQYSLRTGQYTNMHSVRQTTGGEGESYSLKWCYLILEYLILSCLILSYLTV